MASTTVTGRVLATVRLQDGGAATARVITTSWASDRAFPRTQGVGVAFELQTTDGVVLRVEPFEALVTLPVRQSALRDGVRHEDGWIAIDDQIIVEGELDEGELDAAASVPTMQARRIVVDGRDAAVRMRLPPRALERGDVEARAPGALDLEAPPTETAEDAPETIAGALETAPAEGAPETAEVAPGPTPAEDAPETSEAAAEPAPAEGAAEPTVARRSKKKRPDSSGTPTPIQ